MKPHPSEDVNAALVRLNDALCTWERNTGHETALIVRGAGWQHRSLSGKPISDSIADEELTRFVDSANVPADLKAVAGKVRRDVGCWHCGRPATHTRPSQGPLGWQPSRISLCDDHADIFARKYPNMDLTPNR